MSYADIIVRLLTDFLDSFVNIPLAVLANWISIVRRPTSLYDPPDVPGGILFPFLLRPFANALEALLGPFDDFATNISSAIIRAGASLATLKLSMPDSFNTRVVKQNDAIRVAMLAGYEAANALFQGPEEFGAALTADAMVSRFGKLGKVRKILQGSTETLVRFVRDIFVKKLARFVVSAILLGTALAALVFLKRVERQLMDERLWEKVLLPQTKQRAPRKFRGVTREVSSQKS